MNQAQPHQILHKTAGGPATEPPAVLVTGDRSPALAFAGERHYWTNFAFILISTLERAFDTGHSFLAASACSWNVFASQLGTSASLFSSIRLIVGPSVRCTVAVVWIRLGGKPALVSTADRNMEKQP